MESQLQLYARRRPPRSTHHGGGALTLAARACPAAQARDALVVMEGRLSGTLLGVAATPSLPLSCEGQAARLIAEASDHENLGRMYIWWMPWL